MLADSETRVRELLGPATGLRGAWVFLELYP